MEDRFASFVIYMKNLKFRPKTIERYIFTLDKIPEKEIDNANDEIGVKKLISWMKEHDKTNEYSFFKNILIDYYAIRKYMQFLGHKTGADAFKDNISEEVRRLSNVAKKNQNIIDKYHDDAVIEKLRMHSRYELPRKTKDISKKILNEKPEREADRDELFIDLAFFSGCRLFELMSISYNNIDPIKRHISIRGKGNKLRIIPIGEDIIRRVESYMKRWKISKEQILFDYGKPSDDFIIDEKGTKIVNPKKARYIERYGPTIGPRLYKDRLDGRRIEYMIEKLGKICLNRDKNITPHQLRHSLAMFLKKNKVPLDNIQKMLGHQNLQTTQIYAKTSIDELQENYDEVMKRLK